MRPPAGAAIMLAPVPRHLPARHGRIHRATRLSRLPITLPDQVHRRLTFASSFKTFIACPEWLSRERNRVIQDAVMESLRTKKLALSSKRRGLGEGLASSCASLDVVGRNLLSFYFRWIHKEKVAAAWLQKSNSNQALIITLKPDRNPNFNPNPNPTQAFTLLTLGLEGVVLEKKHPCQNIEISTVNLHNQFHNVTKSRGL